MGDYDFDGRGSPLSADLVGFRRMMLVLRFNLLHRATLRQCATKAGCRLLSDHNVLISMIPFHTKNSLFRQFIV